MTCILKQHVTIGACGIDCGLCPRYYTKGNSKCPGCGGADFSEKHPSCGVLTCCVAKHGFETCAECEEFPCNRLNTEKAGYDSFVTHRNMFLNSEYIRNNGITGFLDKQKERMDILTLLLNRFDEGRSKSFYCLSCTLLPLDTLRDIKTFYRIP